MEKILHRMEIPDVHIRLQRCILLLSAGFVQEIIPISFQFFLQPIIESPLVHAQAHNHSLLYEPVERAFELSPKPSLPSRSFSTNTNR